MIYIPITTTIIKCPIVTQCHNLTQKKDYSTNAINRGTAIFRRNTVFLMPPDCTYLARTKILSMLGTGSLLAEVSHFSFHFCLVARDFCYNQLQKCCDTPTFLVQITAGHRSVRYNTDLPRPSHSKLFLQVLSMVLYC